MGSKVNMGSLGIPHKRAGFVSFQRHTFLVYFVLENLDKIMHARFRF